MTNTDRLKAKLKLARKRRRRRTPPASSPAEMPRKSPEATPGPDVAALLAEVILQRSDDGRDEMLDSVVIASLRGLISGSKPNSVTACGLLDEMTRTLDAAGIEGRSRRSAGDELIKLALTNRDPEVPDRFVRYLSLIAV